MNKGGDPISETFYPGGTNGGEPEQGMENPADGDTAASGEAPPIDDDTGLNCNGKGPPIDADPLFAVTHSSAGMVEADSTAVGSGARDNMSGLSIPDDIAVWQGTGDSIGNEEQLQLSAIMEIASAINSKLGLEHILSTISTELSRVIDYDIGCVAIYEKDENCLYIRHVARKSGEKLSEGRYVPLDESNLIGWVAIHKKPILRGNIPEDKRFNEIMKEDNLKSDIVVPLIAKNSLIGTVNIGSYENNHFTPLDLELVKKFSQFTSIAIEKSQLLLDLKDLGEKYRQLVDNATDVIILVNFAGEIIECNHYTFELFGYSAEDVIGNELFMFTSPSRRDEVKRIFYKIVRGEVCKLAETPFLKKNGEIIYMDTDATTIKIKEHPYIIMIAHDVTDRKVLQEKITIQNRELKTINKKLRELDHLKSEFLGRISHELRTPLSIIMAYASTLNEDDESIDLETRTQFLKIIEEQSNKLLGLINDLLDLSKVEISETMLDVTEGSINEIIRISIELVEPLAQQRNIEINCSLDPGIPIMFFDPLRMRQVCVNLLNNAIKYTGRNGQVVVSSRQLEREIVVSVKDTGKGIDERDIPYLFDNFTQIDGGVARSSDGMGIGLRLVKHYVDLHRGKVWVDSERGRGSTFYFSLPLYYKPKEVKETVTGLKPIK